ncbi:hypothetical protein [Streptomyces europaeiscabiei]|uniref:hypothetical protein n=1 Tax=Streptomyces europaeiscabiei TaxID=146819 RepID=UPI002E273E54|nr:hypothetical protein OG858_28525 [Streptomyces europaeiscabiei]
MGAVGACRTATALGTVPDSQPVGAMGACRTATALGTVPDSQPVGAVGAVPDGQRMP